MKLRRRRETRMQNMKLTDSKFKTSPTSEKKRL